MTTGLLLHKRAEEVAALFDDIILSLDGPPEIHDAIRCVNGATNLIQKGVTSIREHNPALPISCRTTVQKANHRYLRKTVDTARSLGLDSISFLAADLTSHALNQPSSGPASAKAK